MVRTVNNMELLGCETNGFGLNIFIFKQPQIMTLINEYNTLGDAGVGCWFSVAIKYLKTILLEKAP